MKKLLFTVLLVVLSSSSVFAQIDIKDKTEKELITIAQNEGFTGALEQQLKELRSIPRQAVIIKQIGDQNTAVVKLNGTGHFAYILQNGNSLKAELTLFGSNNNAIIKQLGSDLLTDIKITGRNNNFKLLQKGSNLSNKIKLLNVAGTDILMMQTNGRFLYSQNGSGNGVPLTIMTSQAVPHIIIRNN